jgi:CBS domain-containing membrane protein
MLSPSGRIRNALVHLGPAMHRPKTREIWRAALTAGGALAICALGLRWFGGGAPGYVLIAPLGASAFLLFAVPNSPLAQPWSAIVGNMASALVAVAVLRLGLPLPAAIGLAVSGAFVAQMLLCAMHPPGAAVALAVALGGPQVQEAGFAFVLLPVGLDTALLVLLAILFNRTTGRVYPFRLPSDAAVPPPPQRRDLPPPEELEELLDSLRLSANIGVEDLRRVLEEIERRHPHLRPPAIG